MLDSNSRLLEALSKQLTAFSRIILHANMPCDFPTSTKNIVYFLSLFQTIIFFVFISRCSIIKITKLCFRGYPLFDYRTCILYHKSKCQIRRELMRLLLLFTLVTGQLITTENDWLDIVLYAISTVGLYTTDIYEIFTQSLINQPALYIRAIGTREPYYDTDLG